MIFEPAHHPDFYFDADAGERPIRFVERFCQHWEGRFAGKRFKLLDWQKIVLRRLFGWKKKNDKLRRFTEAYIITAKGSGKTPFMAAIGLFMLMADGEPGPLVISSATDFPQAQLTHEAGKKYIAAEPELAARCDVIHPEIRAPSNGSWIVMSGTAEGRHGFRPHCILFDEAHEWPSGQLYDNLTANLFKRAQPLAIVCTNAGANRSCFAWKLHERALAVMNRSPDANPSLFPVIFEADECLAWDSEAAAAAANPSLNQIVPFAKLAAEIAKAREDIEGRGRYERLYLSRWSKFGGGRWLNLDQWERARGLFNGSARRADPLYVGLDLSLGDDLCAAVYLWPSPAVWHVIPQFWLPRVTAENYEKQHGHPYSQWAAAGHITLLDETTITPEVQNRIAADIIKRTKTHQLKAVCYDPAYASHAIATLEAASVVCVPVRQGYSLSPGCYELERRLKAGSIIIAPNDVLRFNAENAQITSDQRANIWPVKPHAKNNYTGLRGAKIDGITALVTAATEARKFDFPQATADWRQIVKLV